jgi:hypothetical protein
MKVSVVIRPSDLVTSQKGVSGPQTHSSGLTTIHPLTQANSSPAKPGWFRFHLHVQTEGECGADLLFGLPR